MRSPGNGHGPGLAQNVAQQKCEEGDGENGDEPGEQPPEKFHRGEEFLVEEPGDLEQQEKCGGQGYRQSARGGPADGPSAKEIEIDSFGFGRIGNVGVGEGLDGAESIVAVMLQRGGIGVSEIVEGSVVLDYVAESVSLGICLYAV
jgi:hypothetical protein